MNLKKPRGFPDRIYRKNLAQSLLENVCRNFILNREKQFSTVDYPLPIEDASEVSIHFIPDGTSLDDYLLTHELPLYGKQNEGETIERFITKINIDTVIAQLNCNVIIDGKQFYNNYEVIKTKNESIFKFGKSITIHTNAQLLKYNVQGTMEEQITDILFLLDMIKSRVVLLGDGRLDIPSLEGEMQIVERLSISLKEIKEIQSLFDLFNVNPKSLDIASLDRSSWVNLNVLIGKFLYNKIYEKIPFTTGVNAVKIGDFYLGIFVYKTGTESGYTIINLFDLIKKVKFSIKKGSGEFILVSPYVFLKKDFLLVISNLNMDIILENIKHIQYSEEYYELITDFGLELLKSYDESNRGIFLDASYDLFSWLEARDEDDLISKVNKFQVIRRYRDFTKDEKEALILMKDKFIDNNMGLCSLSILLENICDAEYFLGKLSIEDREVFIEYPIYSLAKKLVIL